MSYITKRPEGAPDWFQSAVLCTVWDDDKMYAKKRYVIDFKEYADYPFITGPKEAWKYAEPIEAWQPAEGEIVAAWENDYPGFCISKFIAETTPGSFMTELSYPVDHVARLVYPDGRIIDCACSVEELKKRVGVGNWL